MAIKKYSEMTSAEFEAAYRENPQAVLASLDQEAQETKERIKKEDIDGAKQFERDSEKKNQMALMYEAALGTYGPAKQKQILASLGTGVAVKAIPGKIGGIAQMIHGTGLMDALIKKYSGVKEAEDAAKEQGNSNAIASHSQEHTSMATLRAAAGGQVSLAEPQQIKLDQHTIA